MANKTYVNPETSRTWSDAGTSSDELLDMGGLAAAALAMGSFWDRGAPPYAEDLELEYLCTGFDTAPVVGEAIHILLSESFSTTGFDGRPTTDPTDTAEGTITENQSKNLKPVGSVLVVSITAGDDLQGRFKFRSTARYLSPVCFNDTADALLSTSDAHLITIRPAPPELQ